MSTENEQTFYEMTRHSFITEDDVSYTAYGIRAFAIENGNKVKLDEVLDVSTDLEFVSGLVEKFNRFDLHREHFRDVVYDSVCAEASVPELFH